MIDAAAEMILNAKRVCAFTGAGISVESGIPPFRGVDGLWTKYNPMFLEIDYFLQNTRDSWKLIKEVFYDFILQAEPNEAHFALARLEKNGVVRAVITQNIDNLHQKAGSRNVYEFHGTAGQMVCLDCKKRFEVSEINLDKLPPECPNCVVGTIKPDFIFFGEAIPEDAYTKSFQETQLSDVFLIIGTTGEIMPASIIPRIAHQNGARIIEINTGQSSFTKDITSVFIEGRATDVLKKLAERL
jgi:NAD-dependent deacetylase